MKRYTEPVAMLLYVERDDILTSSGGDADFWGDDIFAPLDEE